MHSSSHPLSGTLAHRQQAKPLAACYHELRAVGDLTNASHAVWSLAGAGYGGSSYMDPYGTMRGRNTANMTPEESASLQVSPCRLCSMHFASCCSQGWGLLWQHGRTPIVAVTWCPASLKTPPVLRALICLVVSEPRCSIALQ